MKQTVLKFITKCGHFYDCGYSLMTKQKVNTSIITNNTRGVPIDFDAKERFQLLHSD